jgi:hypothetical protein
VALVLDFGIGVFGDRGVVVAIVEEWELSEATFGFGWLLT